MGMYKMERVWREIRNEPGAIAEYLKLFKISTFKKVMSNSMNPDIMPSLFSAVKDHLAASEPIAAARVLKGIAKTDGFSMALMLLADEDKATVRAACDVMGDNESAAIRELYKL